MADIRQKRKCRNYISAFVAMHKTGKALENFTKQGLITVHNHIKNTVGNLPSCLNQCSRNVRDINRYIFLKIHVSVFQTELEMCPSYTGAPTLHCFVNLMTPGQIFLVYKKEIAKFSKSRAITLTKQKKSTSKTPGAQLHVLSNIPVKFHDSRSKPFKLCATQVENLQISHENTRAQLHMLNNIPVKFHDSRSNIFRVMCDRN
jgi:hypothetical protein